MKKEKKIKINDFRALIERPDVHFEVYVESKMNNDNFEILEASAYEIHTYDDVMGWHRVMEFGNIYLSDDIKDILTKDEIDYLKKVSLDESEQI